MTSRQFKNRKYKSKSEQEIGYINYNFFSYSKMEKEEKK